MTGLDTSLRYKQETNFYKTLSPRSSHIRGLCKPKEKVQEGSHFPMLRASGLNLELVTSRQLTVNGREAGLESLGVGAVFLSRQARPGRRQWRLLNEGRAGLQSFRAGLQAVPARPAARLFRLGQPPGCSGLYAFPSGIMIHLRWNNE